MKTILLILLCCVSAQATNYYSSTSGSGVTCSIGSPCSITYATQTLAATGGDTVYLRAGTYTGPQNISINGSSLGSQITFRPYPGEIVILDNPFVGGQSVLDSTLWMSGDYVTIRDLIITNSNTNRVSERPAGLAMTGLGTKAINCVIHDTGDGIFPASTQNGGEITGCLIYNNGWQDVSVGSTGHGIYMQNASGTKLIKDNILWNNYGFGIHGYTTSSDVLKGFNITGNASFNNGSPGASGPQPALLVGGQNVAVSGLSVTFNYFFNGSVSLNYTNTTNNDLVCTDNEMGGTGEISAYYWTNAVFKRNKLFGQDFGYVKLSQSSSARWSSYDWDQNSYYSTNGLALPFEINPTNFYSLGNWRSNTGLDATSTYTPSSPTGVDSFVRVNDYDSTRANMYIYNWAGSSSVTVSVAGKFSNGASLQLFVAEGGQYPNGTPTTTVTVSGGNITVPMNGSTVLAPFGASAPATVRPYFAAWVIKQVTSAPSPSSLQGQGSLRGRVVIH